MKLNCITVADVKMKVQASSSTTIFVVLLALTAHFESDNGSRKFLVSKCKHQTCDKVLATI